MNRRACVVLAAGKGTRMKSKRSKLRHNILGKPLLCWSIDRALELKAEKVIAILKFQRSEIITMLTKFYPEQSVLQICEQNNQAGTAAAVKSALPDLENFSGTVLILYGDTPLLQTKDLEQLCNLREQHQAPLAMWTASLKNPAGYGRILRNQKGEITGIVEDKDASSVQKDICEINPGIYAVDADFLKEALLKVDNNNAQNEYYLTDIVAMAQKQAPIISMQIPFEQTLGVNDRRQLAQAHNILQKRICEQHMLAGVTLENPDTITIEAEVQIAQDVRIQNNVTLKGKTRIDEDVIIEKGCILDGCLVEKAAVLHPYSVCVNTKIGKGANVGPFARLREGTVLGEHSKIGNFVETKKTVFGKGSKASHLSYIGDAQIGERCNIGAGTITCNYDGFAKHLTQMDDGVFIGSNSTLIAPVHIKKAAFVAAGSVVVKEVPENSLAISRVKQDNKIGYAERLRKRHQARKERQNAEK